MHAMLNSEHPGERESVRKAINDLLKKYGKTWNDLPELLNPKETSESQQRTAGNTTSPPNINPVDAVLFVLNKYLDLLPHQALAVALWILHTHVYDRFMVSPRLLLRSPVRGCGKTTLLHLAQRLTARGKRVDSITPAAIYHVVDREHPTLLLDEFDNMDVETNNVLRAILNGGHSQGATRTHLAKGGETRDFSVFGAVAFAVIDRPLPLPLLHRSIIINMTRTSRTNLSRFNVKDEDAMFDLDTIYKLIVVWTNQATLSTDPMLPTQLRNRPGDNWRPLIAIADACGRGGQAREAALILSKNHSDEDIGVILLGDIRNVFDRLHLDRIQSKALVDELCGIEDGVWCEYATSHSPRLRKLTTTSLASLLKGFEIYPRSIWPLHRQTGDTSAKGYHRSQFEDGWARYCPPDGTPAQSSNIKYLGRK
jgi:hypothetical protein